MNLFKGRHFQRDIILWAVRWYCKKGIEVMRALRKGQASEFYYGDPLGEMRLISRIFEVRSFNKKKGYLIANFATVPNQVRLRYIPRENCPRWRSHHARF